MRVEGIKRRPLNIKLKESAHVSSIYIMTYEIEVMFAPGSQASALLTTRHRIANEKKNDAVFSQ